MNRKKKQLEKETQTHLDIIIVNWSTTVIRYTQYEWWNQKQTKKKICEINFQLNAQNVSDFKWFNEYLDIGSALKRFSHFGA